MRNIGRGFKKRVVFLLLTLFGVLVYVIVTYVFVLRFVEVKGDGLGVVVNEHGLPKNLLFFPTDAIEKQILRDNPLIADIHIEKKYPNTLVISATQRVAVATITRGGVVAVLDGSGIILSFEDKNYQLPMLEFDVSPGPIGTALTDPNVQGALMFLVRTKSLLPIQKITNGEGSSLLAISDKTNILFAQQSDGQAIAATLQTLLSGFRIKGTLPTTIDLRFDKPIVKF